MTFHEQLDAYAAAHPQQVAGEGDRADLTAMARGYLETRFRGAPLENLAEDRGEGADAAAPVLRGVPLEEVDAGERAAAIVRADALRLAIRAQIAASVGNAEMLHADGALYGAEQWGRDLALVEAGDFLPSSRTLTFGPEGEELRPLGPALDALMRLTLA